MFMNCILEIDIFSRNKRAGGKGTGLKSKELRDRSAHVGFGLLMGFAYTKTFFLNSQTYQHE